MEKKSNKIRKKVREGLCLCTKRKEKVRGREREALQPISGAITGRNGSHLSHLDIWEDLWLHRREGQAEVSVERVLHRGLWHGSDDTASLQQWEVKGKNNRALGQRGGGVDVAQRAEVCAVFFKHTVPAMTWAWATFRTQNCFVLICCITDRFISFNKVYDVGMGDLSGTYSSGPNTGKGWDLLQYLGKHLLELQLH